MASSIKFRLIALQSRVPRTNKKRKGMKRVNYIKFDSTLRAVNIMS